MRPVLSVILPVHNQADHIAPVVDEYRAALSGLAVGHEILLVVNGSRDASLACCRALAARYPDVIALEAPRAGWGLAVRAGLGAARGDVLCYTNSARTRGEDLRRIVKVALSNPLAVVKADRRLRDGLRRRIGSLLFNLEARSLFGITTRDVNGTPKVFPRRFAALLALTRDDDLIDLEFCAACRREGYPILQVPVDSRNRHGGRSTTNWRSALRLYRGAWALRRAA